VGEGERDIVVDFRQGQDVLDLSGYAELRQLPDLFRPPVRLEPIFLGDGDFIASFALQVRSEVLPDGCTLVQFATASGQILPPAGTEPETPDGPTGEIELFGRLHLTTEDFVL
jgi:hypothetical protein